MRLITSAAENETSQHFEGKGVAIPTLGETTQGDVQLKLSNCLSSSIPGF